MKIDHKQSYIDFGEQFKVDKKIDGYHGIIRLLKDIVRPFKLNNISGKKIMEIGSGSGRILKNLIKFKPSKIIGIEPSDAAEVARKNINSNLKGASFTKALIESTYFYNSNLDNASFTWSKILNSSFINTSLNGTNIDQADKICNTLFPWGKIEC